MSEYSVYIERINGVIKEKLAEIKALNKEILKLKEDKIRYSMHL